MKKIIIIFGVFAMALPASAQWVGRDCRETGYGVECRSKDYYPPRQ